MKHNLHITTNKKVTPTDDTPLNWDSFTKFRAQCEQTDSTADLTTVVSKMAFKLIIMATMGKLGRIADSHSDRYRSSQ